MAFYQQFPAIYAYPMPFPNQDFYAMYPPGHMPPTATAGADGAMYFADHHHHHHPHHHSGIKSTKVGYNNRKESTDSGISEFSMGSSRKTSSTSTVSNSSLLEDQHLSEHLEDIKEEEPFEEPEDDLCEKIVQQVEFYFSDANITKDKFLLKHVKRNKEGFVSLKLISSFKRVKHLTKDWRQVAYAIERKSKKLEVNDVKTKVRRLDALPEYDEMSPSRTVVALNLPIERPTIEAVAELFTVCGEIALVRILRPGNPVPADVKPFANKHPEMTAKVCALVEFERTEFALRAVRELNNADEEDKMKVMELTAPPPKSTKKDDKKQMLFKTSPMPPTAFVPPLMAQHAGFMPPSRRFSHAGFAMPQQQNPDHLVLGPRRKISLFHNIKFAQLSEEQQSKAAAEAASFALNPNAPTFHMQQRRMARAPIIAQQQGLEASFQQMHMHQPWAAMGPRRLSAMEAAASGLTLPTNVLRMPRGPDNGKGFQKWCRNRMETNPAPASAASPPAPPASRKSHAIPIVAPPTAEDKPAEAEAAVDDGAAAAVDPAVDGAAAAPVAVAVAGAGRRSDSDSDSGNEDDHFSDIDLVDGEKSR